MPDIPAGISSVLVTGRYVRPDGTPCAGQVTFDPPGFLTFSGADVISSGSATATLDETGAFELLLIATDSAGMDPTGWTYSVTEKLGHAGGRSYAIALPAATPVVDLADIAPADPANGDYVLVTGPAGADGSKIYSSAGAPTADVGANGDYYIDTTPGAVTWYGPKSGGTWPAGTVLTGSGSAPVTSVAGKTGAVTLAVADVSGAVATGDARLSDARTPTGSAGGDLGGTYPSPTVTATHLAAPLPVAQGGTGASSPSAALTALGGVATSSRGVASGVATLGTDARLPTSQAPAVANVLYKRKAADTPRNTTATPTADTDLTVTVVAGAEYDVEVVAAWSNGGGGFRATWVAPAGCSMTWTDNDGVGQTSVSGNVTFAGTSGTTLKGTLVVGGTGGTFGLSWAQSTSNAADTTLRAGSSIKLARVA